MKSTLLMALSFMLVFAAPVSGTDSVQSLGIEISDVWARKTRRTTSAAVYLNVHNSGDTAEAITGVTSPIARMTMLHMSREVDGVMRMDMQESVPVAPGSTVSFEPGGLHIMLMGLSQPLAEGDVFPVTLTFENAGEVTVEVNVTGLSGPTEMMHH